jgi:hypothetical protein
MGRCVEDAHLLLQTAMPGEIICNHLTWAYLKEQVEGEPIRELKAAHRSVLVSLSVTAPPFILGVAIYVGLALYLAYFREHLVDKACAS